MMTINNPVLVCTSCGEANGPFETTCLSCGTSLDNVFPVEAADLLAAFQMPSPLTAKLVKLSLGDRSVTAEEKPLASADGSFVMGRASGSFMPDIDLKSFSESYVSDDPADPLFNQRQRGISRQHAVLVHQGDQFSLYRHPDASANLPVKVNGQLVTGTDESQAVSLNSGDIIELGDIFAPKSKPRAPGVLLQFVIQ